MENKIHNGHPGGDNHAIPLPVEPSAGDRDAALCTDDRDIFAQASAVERLMPQLGRRLFTVNPDDPYYELPVTQVRVCTVLQAGPASMSLLGEELGISTSAVTQIADRLERAGMVERICECEDRRIKKLVLTSHGEDVMRRRWHRRVSSVAEALALLPPERRVEIISALRDLLAATKVAIHRHDHIQP
ncbi:MAG: MarR family winged helix-turn-helix transcriptional regulator [Capsulimonadaceae bacterium]